MTTTLEGIMGKLRNPNSGYKTVNPHYDSETLTSAANFSEKLLKANPSTTEGLEAYRDATGLKTKGRTENAIALEIRQIKEAYGEGLEEFISKHAKPIANKIEEQKRTEIAYAFSPEEGSKIQGSREYVTAIKTVSEAKARIKTIKEDPKAHLKARIAAAPDYMKGIIVKFSDEALRIDIESEQRTALKAIAKVGTDSFIASTHRGLTTLRTAYQTELETIDTEEEKKLRDMPQHFDAKEKAQYLTEIRNKKTKLEETRTDFAMLPELTDTLFEETVSAIKKRTAPATP